MTFRTAGSQSSSVDLPVTKAMCPVSNCTMQDLTEGQLYVPACPLPASLHIIHFLLQPNIIVHIRSMTTNCLVQAELKADFASALLPFALTCQQCSLTAHGQGCNTCLSGTSSSMISGCTKTRMWKSLLPCVAAVDGSGPSWEAVLCSSSAASRSSMMLLFSSSVAGDIRLSAW